MTLTLIFTLIYKKLVCLLEFVGNRYISIIAVLGILGDDHLDHMFIEVQV
jgi:hypothetical protein